MVEKLEKKPLVSWGPMTFYLDKEVLRTYILRVAVQKNQHVHDLEVNGSEDRLLFRLYLRVMAIPVKIDVELAEVCFRHGFFGCRLLALRGPFGFAAPNVLLSLLFRKLPLNVSWEPSERVLLLDLRSKLPLGLDLEVDDIRLRQNTLAVHINGGSFSPPLPFPSSPDEEHAEPPVGV